MVALKPAVAFAIRLQGFLWGRVASDLHDCVSIVSSIASAPPPQRLLPSTRHLHTAQVKHLREHLQVTSSVRAALEV